MNSFTTETLVRLRFQVEEAHLASAELLEAAIAEAHVVILARLAAGVDTGTPPDRLILGETLLAGSVLLRAVASKEAVARRDVTVGGQRVESAKRVAALTALAQDAEDRAWETLAPYLTPPGLRKPGCTTDTTPVLG
jgi:hypothetical protein